MNKCFLADGDLYFSGNAALSAGVQYAWKSLLYVRGGYHLASAGCVIPSHLALGLGVRFKGVRIDASYLTASETLGNTFQVALAYGF